MQGRQWEDLGRQTELSMEENGRRAGQDTTAQALQAQLQAGPQPPHLQGFFAPVRRLA